MTELRLAVAAHRELVAQLRQQFPGETEESLADTIEGATTLDAAILATIRAAIEREAQAEAVKGMIEVLTSRQRRLAEGAQAMRTAALNAMLESGLTKLAAPDISLSVGTAKPKVVITDESLIPPDYTRVKVEPNKVAIGEALKAGNDVPGAMLGNAGSFLTVHRR